MARAEFDRGLVTPSLPMDRIVLILKRSPEQDAALEAFMARQLDPSSADFHHWLEPEQFGRLYGPSDQDIQSVTAWLQNHGFSVDNVSKGRTFIQFSGTAELVQQAFHTEIHQFMVKGEHHVANNVDPSIPEALSPVVAGIMSLHDFHSKPLHRDLGSFHRDVKTGKWVPENDSVVTKPMFNVSESNGTFELVSPYDFAAIYNVLPLWNAHIDGTGQTIAIAGRSDISLTDVNNFRAAFGLPVNTPTIIVNGTDPGVPSADDKSENTLDVEWSGAVAKGAKIKFVTTASTNASDGASVSAQYIIDNKTAPVMSFSYGNCELAYGTAGNQASNMMWQQGAAEGITEFVSSGDQGAAACDGGQQAPYAAGFGLAVSGTSTTPYDVAVGGTDLNWANNSSKTYWNASNDSKNLSSALGYMPEVPWNGTCVSDSVDALLGATQAGLDEEQTCEALLDQNVALYLVNVTGGTGGKSACTAPTSNTAASCAGGYPKPSWQTGQGVPADGKRDVPDVSLFASSGALNTAYVICDSQTTPCTFSDPNDTLAQAVGGTSVASPAMAGIMALVNQQMKSPQGNANVAFYALAARDSRSSCDTNKVGQNNSCNFYDITTDNIAVPCAPGSPDCTVHHSGDQVGVLNGIKSTAGYDLATGLGSINANNLVNNWHLVAGTSSAPVVSLSKSSLSFGSIAVGSSSAAQTVTITNTGNATLNIPANGGLSIDGADFASFPGTTTCATTLAPSASCTVSITFQPATAGNLTASLDITDDAGNSPQSVALSGTGTTGGGGSVSATLSPSSLNFGTVAVGSTSGTQTATLKNTGSGTLTISSGGVTIGGANPSAFGGTTTCGTSLSAGSTCTVSISFTPSAAGSFSATLSIADNATGSPQTVALTGTGQGGSGGGKGLQFIAVTPCRIADTRNASGAFGGPALTGGSSRTFNIPGSGCKIPGNAVAYSLNVTVVPPRSLGYLTMWPAGQAQPNVSTLNSDGRIKANAAITPAGAGGGVSIYVSDTTHVILDIDGYFVPAGTASALAFYPVTPCRVADTRGATGAMGGPSLPGGSTRSFPVLSSKCGLPSSAKAYSLNVTAIPHGTLSYLTSWPSGSAQPNVSTLNATTGAIAANAAIVPAASNGAISIFVSDAADVILDVNGYFAAPSSSGLALYTVNPCRALDTRTTVDAFTGEHTAAVAASTCHPSSAAKAYVLNATVVPDGTLDYLSLWPDGQGQPNVSTLNALDGAVTSNMAIVPNGDGSTDAFASGPTNLILDISSYFAP